MGVIIGKDDPTNDLISLPILDSISGGRLVIMGFAKDSNGEKAGLKKFDIITKINDVGKETDAELTRYLKSLSESGPQSMKLTVLRL